MTINAELSKLLNDQINSELTAGYVYLDMAASFEAIELPGFTSWFKARSKKEMDHAMRILDLLAMRSNKIELAGIKKPSSNYDSPKAALKTCCAGSLTNR